MGNVPDAVKRLVDHFDRNRKVFISGDYQAGTRDWGLGARDPNPSPNPPAPNPSFTALGQVYEQFLGKVIRLTAGHQAKVEEKPEVRKAGGVYYTPRSPKGRGIERCVTAE